MEIIINTQSRKYLAKTDATTRAKLLKAIDDICELKGDIVKLKGSDMFRLKIYHYRILFTYDTATARITIERIGTRGDVYKGGLR